MKSHGLVGHAAPARRSDDDAVATTLARAFQNEPAFSWIIPDPAERAARLKRVFSLFVPMDHARGAVMATPDCKAVTLWRGPGQQHDGLGWMLRYGPAFAMAFGPAIFRALAVANSIDRHLPEGDYWYLHMAACDPDYQGRGLGGSVIRAGLALADTAGLPAYLETADPANVALYQAQGFIVQSQWQVGADGPHFWGMMRPAISSSMR